VGDVKKSAIVEVDRFTVHCPHCGQLQTGPVSGAVNWYGGDAYDIFHGEGARYDAWPCDGCEREIVIDTDVVSELEAAFHCENG
jgi:hypothetical protein